MENSSNEQSNNDLKASLTTFKLFLTEALLEINKAIQSAPLITNTTPPAPNPCEKVIPDISHKKI